MREPLALPPDAIAAALRAGYGIDAATITFLPLGYDSAASVYRATTTDGRDYFLKLRSDGINPAALAVPRWLNEQGLSEVLAPLRTTAGALWQPLEGYALIAYPFLPDAVPLPSVATDASGAADAQWRRFGALMRRIHAAVPPPEVEALLRRETFTPVAVERVRRLDVQVPATEYDEPLRRAVAETWRAHRNEIHLLIERVETLGARLRAAPPTRRCICHADPHWSNVLVEAAGRLWLVDWDDTLLAVPERDLMFVMGGISDDWGRPRDTAIFMEGYGAAEVNLAALRYYRADWALGDISAYADDVLRAPTLGAATRQDALRLFTGQFDPGGMVAIALDSGAPHG